MKEHEVTLHIPQVLPHHFTTFTLDVVNIVGNSSAQVVLLKGKFKIVLKLPSFPLTDLIWWSTINWSECFRGSFFIMNFTSFLKLMKRKWLIHQMEVIVQVSLSTPRWLLSSVWDLLCVYHAWKDDKHHTFSPCHFIPFVFHHFHHLLGKSLWCTFTV